MTLAQLLDRANQGYPDGFLTEYYDPDTGEARAGSGDTLALFIVTELRETFDPTASDETQLAEARRVLDRAQEELAGVIASLAATGRAHP